MDEWFSGVVVALAIPVLAYALRFFINRMLKQRTKEVVATDDVGRTETLLVPARADSKQIMDRVKEAYAFEAEVAKALKELQILQPTMKIQEERSVDFVAEWPDNKIAVEAKLTANRMDPARVQKYLSSVSGLTHVLLVTRTPPSEKVATALDSLIKEKRFSFITVPQGVEAMPLIQQALSNVKTGGSEVR